MLLRPELVQYHPIIQDKIQCYERYELFSIKKLFLFSDLDQENLTSVLEDLKSLTDAVMKDDDSDSQSEHESV